MPNQPEIRLGDDRFFVGEVLRIGELKSLFPDVRATAPSILVRVTETDMRGMDLTNESLEWRFTFFCPSLMEQWSATPATVGEFVHVRRFGVPATQTKPAGVRWRYEII